MTLKEFQIYFTNRLKDVYPKTEIDSFFAIILQEKLDLERVDTILKPNLKISSQQILDLENIINELQKEKPIQYILGVTEFFGLPFRVNKNTLIPRPETEELVEWILKDIQEKNTSNKDQKLKVLDIGTGSGCIPISLSKHLPNAEISAIDVSKQALSTAKENAILNNVSINFIEMDILQTKSLPNKYDIIISNPPYVRNLEKAEIKNNVLKNEPHLALFVENENPLLFYNKIADLAKQYLTKNGTLFFEINQYLGKETVHLLKEKGFLNIELRKDLFGNERMLKISLYDS